MPALSPPTRYTQAPLAVVQGEGFRILSSALERTGLLQRLQRGDPFTLFAPTDEAFRAMPPDQRALVFDPAQVPALTALLAYHVIPGCLATRDLLLYDCLPTFHGAEVAVMTQVSTVQVNHALVVAPDQVAAHGFTHGVVHGIDAVLLPPSSASA